MRLLREINRTFSRIRLSGSQSSVRITVGGARFFFFFARKIGCTLESGKYGIQLSR